VLKEFGIVDSEEYNEETSTLNLTFRTRKEAEIVRVTSFLKPPFFLLYIQTTTLSETVQKNGTCFACGITLSAGTCLLLDFSIIFYG